jgi:multidrug efflux pump subunit AcrA (membrane-fusion protein)
LLDPQTQTFTVEAIFEKAPGILYPGMTTEANIIIHQKDKAMVIPKSYLIGKDTVLVNKNEKKKITTGIGNLEFVEVLQGLDSNTLIYKP